MAIYCMQQNIFCRHALIKCARPAQLNTKNDRSDQFTVMDTMFSDFKIDFARYSYRGVFSSHIHQLYSHIFPRSPKHRIIPVIESQDIPARYSLHYNSSLLAVSSLFLQHDLQKSRNNYLAVSALLQNTTFKT